MHFVVHPINRTYSVLVSGRGTENETGKGIGIETGRGRGRGGETGTGTGRGGEIDIRTEEGQGMACSVGVTGSWNTM